MVGTVKRARRLKRGHITRLFDDADDFLIASGVAANRAQFLVSQIRALPAAMNRLLDVSNCVGELQGLCLRNGQNVVGQPLCRLAADSRQRGELLHQTTDRRSERMLFHGCNTAARHDFTQSLATLQADPRPLVPVALNRGGVCTRFCLCLRALTPPEPLQ